MEFNATRFKLGSLKGDMNNNPFLKSAYKVMAYNKVTSMSKIQGSVLAIEKEASCIPDSILTDEFLIETIEAQNSHERGAKDNNESLYLIGDKIPHKGKIWLTEGVYNPSGVPQYKLRCKNSNKLIYVWEKELEKHICK